MNLLYLDIEWANNQNKSICQIGLLIKNNNIKEQPIIEKEIYVNPNDGFDPLCVAINGITIDKVKDCPTFDLVWQEIKHYFYKSIIIGHNVAGADLDALVKNLSRYQLDIPDLYYIDTLSIARKYIEPYKVKDYKLESLCEYYGIDFFNHHNAFEDARMAYTLLDMLIKDYDLDIMDFINHFEYNYIKDYSKYISNSEIRNDVYELLGHILAFEMNKKLSTEETTFIKNWYDKHKTVFIDDSFDDILMVLENILQDNIITLDELNSLKKVIYLYIQVLRSSEVTIGTQILKNIALGIKTDDKIEDTEILSLQKWLYENSYLKDNYPYDTICDTVIKVLNDGIITNEEKDEIIKTIEELFDPLNKIEKQLIDFNNKAFCLSGEFNYGSKAVVGEYIKSKGGIIHDNVKKSTNYVVIGALGSMAYANGNYGSKVKKAKEWNIPVIKEEQLFN